MVLDNKNTPQSSSHAAPAEVLEKQGHMPGTPDAKPVALLVCTAMVSPTTAVFTMISCDKSGMDQRHERNTGVVFHLLMREAQTGRAAHWPPDNRRPVNDTGEDEGTNPWAAHTSARSVTDTEVTAMLMTQLSSNTT